MDLISKYADDASDDDGSGRASMDATPSAAAGIVSSGIRVNGAPDVDLRLHELERKMMYIAPSTKEIHHNPTVEQLWQPTAGPANPFNKDAQAPRNMLTGYMEPAHYDNTAFEEQYNTFITYGYARDPSVFGGAASHSVQYVGDAQKFAKTGGASASAPPSRTTGQAKTAEQSAEEAEKKAANKRKKAGDPSDVSGYLGPWAPLEREVRVQEELTEEQKKYVEELAAKKAKKTDDVVDTSETSTFHGKEEKDYQGRSWLHHSGESKAAEKNFIPKQAIHTYHGHSKGVSAIRFFPGSGHLLLSASMDSTLKIWGTEQGKRQCMRTYMGHSQSVRDVVFSPDGSRFLSASFDKYIKLWDTETGQCISRHTTKKIPYCVRFHPDRPNECLVGQNNKKIVQWDLSSDTVAQEYEEHLGAVNTVTFIDENRRFISTSDDKKIFIWEYGIPVVIKHIAESDQHSVPYVELHPSNKWILGQSQDNQILVYATNKGFKLNTKKRFKGHLNAGYAAQISVSPDGKLVMSGDGDGHMVFWDWATTKMYKKIKAHDQVCIGAAWHPLETSKVATCSWDGLIKYWD